MIFTLDEDGPIKRLNKLLFSQITFETLSEWVIEYWWAVLLMGIGFITFMGLFIKCCAAHTPSSNPKYKGFLNYEPRPPKSDDSINNLTNYKRSIAEINDWSIFDLAKSFARFKQLLSCYI